MAMRWSVFVFIHGPKLLFCYPYWWCRTNTFLNVLKAWLINCSYLIKCVILIHHDRDWWLFLLHEAITRKKSTSIEKSFNLSKTHRYMLANKKKIYFFVLCLWPLLSLRGMFQNTKCLHHSDVVSWDIHCKSVWGTNCLCLFLFICTTGADAIC